MAMLPPAMGQRADRCTRTLAEIRRITAVYVHGCHERGTATRWREADLAVISPDFSADPSQEHLALLCAAAQIDDRIGPDPFRLEDTNASNALRADIRQTGVRVV